MGDVLNICIYYSQFLQAVGNIVDRQTVEKTRNRYTVHKEFGDRRKDVVSARYLILCF